ncbi:MAG: type II toxin-antitoxin system RelE/ParE family toxin [Spirochaetales bacterium]|nr:type II toxin-antitoxin system RelE/ParE family toxin [Spirochaetales bacterium]
MHVKFLSVAESEFKESISYYNSQSEGLGYVFALEIRKSIERIVQFPEAWNKFSYNTRRCRCKRFPFSIIYQFKNNEILIVAIMHMNRDPKKLNKRI